MLNSFLKYIFEGTATSRPFYLSQNRAILPYANLSNKFMIKHFPYGTHPYFEKSSDVNVKGSTYFVLRPLNPILLPFSRYRLDAFRNSLKQLLDQHNTRTRSITQITSNAENQTESFLTEREYQTAAAIDKTGHLGRVPTTYSLLSKAKNALSQFSILALESLYRPVVY